MLSIFDSLTRKEFRPKFSISVSWVALLMSMELSKCIIAENLACDFFHKLRKKGQHELLLMGEILALLKSMEVLPLSSTGPGFHLLLCLLNVRSHSNRVQNMEWLMKSKSHCIQQMSSKPHRDPME